MSGRTYSVPSRLIEHEVEVRQHADWVEVYYANECVERMPRLRGRREHRIDYRHVDLVAGAKAWSVCALPLSGGAVPDAGVPRGVRCPAPLPGRAGGHRVRAVCCTWPRARSSRR